ncbi:MAG: tetratricopeptide repeat protein [Scytolyngbya sp. HA4215-MV1]|nr:tetratricopeptide repeat protein [Scytolyngbya sp. HA4215-MV1]
MYPCRLYCWFVAFCLLFFPWVEPGIVFKQVALARSLHAQNHDHPNRELEANRLFEMADRQFLQGQWQQALATFQQTLAIRQALGDRLNEGRTLTAIGRMYHSLGDYPQALTVLQKALAINRSLHDHQGEGATLNELGVVHRKLSRYDEAIAFHQQALAVSQQVGDRLTEGRILNELGAAYGSQGKYGKALEIQQQALTLTRAVRDRVGEGRVLSALGYVYSSSGDYTQALKFYQQSLDLRRELGDRAGEARTLGSIGAVYDGQGNYEKALALYQPALSIQQEIGDRAGAELSLGNIGLAYSNLGQFNKALEFYPRALAIASQIGDRAGQAYLLTSIGTAYANQGAYAKALTAYQQGLAIQQAIGDRAAEGHTLNSIGAAYNNLGQTDKALTFYQQALTIRREIGDRAGEARTLSNLGGIYDSLKQADQALGFYQQALTIRREIGDRAGEGITLNSLGSIYSELGESQRALVLYQQALTIHQATGDRAREGETLNNLALIYDQLNQKSQAKALYQQALGILREIGDRAGERLVLSNLGLLLEKQNQPQLAIAFYKQSVNVTESIRRDLKTLSRQEQETYTQTVATTYRALADLLLAQGRILEAQQVLELLKVQELQNFTRESNLGARLAGVVLNPIEEKILQQHGTLIAFGQQIETCKQTRCDRLSQLNDQLQALTQEYNQTVETLEKEIRQRRAEDDAFLDPVKLLPRARRIIEAEPGTVLIYPLVLKDKIWLILAAQGGVVKSAEVLVSERQLGETVLKFREQLQDPTASVQALQETSQQLYTWLIHPIEAELRANQIHNLVFSLDRVTRYIPMSTLFDGKQYLIENYAVSTILAADLTDMRDRLPTGTQNTTVLAVGASTFSDLSPLPNVPAELAAIVRKHPTDSQGIYPGLEFLDRAFDFRALRDNLSGRKILHIATHGAFVPGRPEDSYLILGNGSKLTTDDIKTLTDLSDVHLVVLSACETALGGPDQDGVEISGISSYFLNAGASAVLASLWSVNDASTSNLMQQFYRNLAQTTPQTRITKAEALRQAQLSLLYGKADWEFAHPYYWAPFILIGNGF